MTAMKKDPCFPLPGEIWKPVSGFEGVYDVSNLGRVRRVSSFRPGLNGLLTPRLAPNGYFKVRLTNCGKVKPARLHRIMAIAHLPGYSPELVCAHKDGNPKNNSLSNLLWCTHNENMQHKFLHGTNPEGIRHPSARFTETQIRHIFKRRKAGGRVGQIAKEMETCSSHISAILARRLWGHLNIADAPSVLKYVSHRPTNLQVMAMRMLRAAGVTYVRISEIVGTSYSSVRSILLGQFAWANQNAQLSP